MAEQSDEQKAALATHKCNPDLVKLFVMQFIEVVLQGEFYENVRSIDMANSVIDPTVSS